MSIVRYPAQPHNLQNRSAIRSRRRIILVAKQKNVIDRIADFSRGGVHQPQAHVPARIFHAVKIARDASIGSQQHDPAGVRKEIRFGVKGVPEIRGFSRRVDAFLRAGQEVPTRRRLRLAKMFQRARFFLRGHVRGFARIKTDKHHFVIAPRRERQHPQRTHDALLHLVAEHRAAVINKASTTGFCLK